jgi:predicted ATPase/DNA-binding SARP family transcriptional activator
VPRRGAGSGSAAGLWNYSSVVEEASPTSRVRLLGPIDVVSAAGEVHVSGSPLRRTLVALLALRASEMVSADWLLEHAWGNRPPESRLRALRFHVSRLRRELPDPALIETCAGGYRLALPEAAVDALEVQSLVRQARNHADPRRAVVELERALSFWRGAPFVDASPCAILDDEAQRFAELHIAILDEYYVAHLETGATTDVIADLSRLVADHPLRESLWSSLITAQYRAGRQADALRSFEELRRLLAETAGLSPSPQLQQLQTKVLDHDPGLLTVGSATPVRVRGVRGNLPTSTTALVDGDDRLSVVRMLVQNHRLVTLTGTGGVGKTRTALELGRSMLDRFDAGAWFVELAPLTQPDDVVAVVSSTLSIPAQSSLTPIESIVDWMREREMLLIVDNCEHVLDGVRALLAVLVSRCPSLNVVATSREPIGVAGERVHSVDVLDADVDGARLFLDRAEAADSSFRATEVELGAITEICRILDGLPLAIELASARVRSMGPVDLLSRLDDRFRLLRGRLGDGSGRHESLDATVAWSYQLLNEQERTTLDRCSVFAGSFDAAAVAAFCVPDTSDELDVLRSLVDKSLVIAERQPHGTRYRLLDTIRAFAHAKLGAAGKAAEVRDRHLAHYAEVAERLDNLFRGAMQVTASRNFEQEWDNLRAAHEWAVLTSDLTMAERLVSASRLYATIRLRYEHREWVERTIALETDERHPQSATFAQAAFWAAVADDDYFQLLHRALQLAAPFDDPIAALALTHTFDGDDDLVQDPVAALELVAATMDLDREWWVLEALADRTLHPQHLARLASTAERVRAPALMVSAARLLGQHALDSDAPDIAGALDHLQRALELARLSGDPVSEADCLRAVATAHALRDPRLAIPACHEALINAYDARHWFRIWQLFESVGLALAEAGRLEAAAVVVGNLEAHHLPFGMEHNFGFRTRTLDIVHTDPSADTWMARGAAMDRYQVVEFAIAAVSE